MTHNGSPNKFIFFPNEVEITDISNGKVIEKGVVGHSLKVYKFPISYLSQTPQLFSLMLMNQASFGMIDLAILTTGIFNI